jgi:hypothetical protein
VLRPREAQEPVRPTYLRARGKREERREEKEAEEGMRLRA